MCCLAAQTSTGCRFGTADSCQLLAPDLLVPLQHWPGLSGSGKSTVACTLEHLLHERGHFTSLLDGDNIRHGLNKDLGFRCGTLPGASVSASECPPARIPSPVVNL